MVSFKNIQNKTLWICISAIFMGLNILMSAKGITVPGGHLYLNDAVICTAALLLDPVAAAIVGGLGAFLGDFFFYPKAMFVSLVVHGVQAAVISIIAHRTFKNKQAIAGAIGVFVGAVIMVVGYTFGRAFVYSTMAESIVKLPFQILQASVGAVAGWVIVFPVKLGKVFRNHVPVYKRKNSAQK